MNTEVESWDIFTSMNTNKVIIWIRIQNTCSVEPCFLLAYHCKTLQVHFISYIYQRHKPRKGISAMLNESPFFSDLICFLYILEVQEKETVKCNAEFIWPFLFLQTRIWSPGCGHINTWKLLFCSRQWYTTIFSYSEGNLIATHKNYSEINRIFVL